MGDITKVYQIGHLVEEVKVRFRKETKLGMFNVSIDAKEGDIQMLPRWLANILQEAGLAEAQEQDLGVELMRALSRERIAGTEQVSGLKPDFYVRVNDFISRTSSPEKEKLNVSMQDLVLLRLGKVIHFARSAPLTPDLEQKLTHEEKTLFQLVHKATSDFREYVLGGKK